MAESNITRKNSSNTRNYVELIPQVLVKSSITAWVPAVSVAIAMLIFLTASFYIRHRKVVKKRQILMDYFYIILQYGGIRRKRMVTAICNTNAITLRQLGRSFMISFDSNENSCPFFLEDTAFTKHSSTPVPPYKNSSKTMNKLRAPFRRVMSQIDDGGVHDILMKFKKRKGPSQTQTNKHTLAPPRGNSLSSIHEDDTSFVSRSEFETTPQFNQRRNAYVLGSYDSRFTSMAELLNETDEQSSNVMFDHYRSRRASSVKRMSFPYNSSDAEDEEFHVINSNPNNLRVFQLGTNSARKQSPTPFQQSRSRSGSRQYSNKEPLILVHTASNDISSSQESDEVIEEYSNGVVLVRRVSRDCSQGEHHHPVESPRHLQRKRASLSTVSYVQSSNINDYHQHCLKSPKRTSDLKSEEDEFNFEDEKRTSKPKGWPWRKSASKKESPLKTIGPSRSKRSRLSLGEIGISNFNRRIEESLGSMQEHENEGSFYRTSKDLPDNQRKSHGAWRRLKNVFAGIRWSQTSGTKLKQVKSSISEERNKSKNKRNTFNGKWNRFFNVLTGFRSLPEDKNYNCHFRGPKSSKSLPMGLDKHSLTLDDLEFHIARSMDSQTARHKKRNLKHSFSRADMVDDKTYLRAPPKTRSFPDNIVLFQGDTPKSPCLYHLQSDPTGTASYQKYAGRKYKRRFEAHDDQVQFRSNVDFLQSPLHTGYLPLSLDSKSRTYRHPSGSISPRATSPVARRRDRRYRSLSPLPERKFCSSPRKEKNVRLYSHSARNSLSERGRSMSPTPRPGGSCNNVSFPSQILSKSNDCLQDSDEDLETTTPLLSAKDIDQTTGEITDAANKGDLITIDMEPSVMQGQNVTSTTDSDVKDCHEEVEEEPKSLESDSFANCFEENNSEAGMDSQSKSSAQTHDKTSSSLDSLYFDTFSIPGSPLQTNRTCILPLVSDLIPSCSCETHTSTSFSLRTPLYLDNSLSSFVIHNNPHSSEARDIDKTSEDHTNVISSLSSSDVSASQTSLVAERDDPLPIYSATTNPCSQLRACDTFVQPTVNLPSYPVSSNNESRGFPQETSLSTHPTNTPSNDSEMRPQTNFYIHPRSSLRQASLERQESLTSDEESLVNLTRLPRFGRRASQCASPSPDANSEGRKNESLHMGMQRRETIPETDPEPSPETRFVCD